MEENPICKSIFKNGKAEPEQGQVTKAWITLINEMEHSKILLAGTRQT